MKKRAKLTMSSLALTVLCCYSCLLALASGLPITSKPLDNSPDHLTWQAAWLSGDSTAMRGKTKKITKSIFIAPQLNGFNGSLCPPDMKIDYNGKCIEVLNINQDQILVTKLQAVLSNAGGVPSTGGEEEYDYDMPGPLQVNLPLDVDIPFEQSPLQARPIDNYYDSTDLDKHSIKQTTADTVATQEQKTTFLGTPSRPSHDQSTAETHTDISFLTFESLPNGTLSTQLEMDGNNGTVVQQIVLTSTAATPTTTEVDGFDAESSVASITSTVASFDATSTVLSNSTEESSTSTTEVASTTESVTSMTTILSTTTEKQPNDRSHGTTTEQPSKFTVDDDFDGLKSELAEESLILESSSFISTDLPSTMADDIETESESSDKKAWSMTTTKPPTESTSKTDSSTMKVLIHTIPPTAARTPYSPKPVQVVTPVRNKWYSSSAATPLPFIVASYTQQERTTRATPETTTPIHDRSTETPLLVIVNDTEADKKNRDTIHRQEVKEKLRETMDTNNRFVYHHLPAPVQPSTESSTTPDRSYSDQLRKINEIVAENRQRHQQNSRIRFPNNRDDDQHSAATNNNVVRFPGSVASRVTPQHVNRLPDIFPKKSTDSTTQRPPFWWLPSGWEVDQTGQKPMLLRFWSRMPLVRDQSITTSSSSSSSGRSSSNRWRPSTSDNTSPSSVAPRGNSRSPSENFYKEVSSQDVYKVLNMRQMKHKR
ncbi:mucin-2-like [Wyeomyia smithii]|uniref:mucin-2-like n=1 Tax=Wyeomyia smithii TaxID=174621 RepID=UPI002467DF7D|nr:mucin-2-like [Wyeomyia smithii]XP_055529129.1 mucin-2-like [Wyeomyia smithii]